MEKVNLWNVSPDGCEDIATITYYEPINKTTDSAIVILPGGAYFSLAEHEGKGYAEFFAQNGITSFVVEYRVSPKYHFPAPLLDARRAIRYVRYYADKFGINKNKIAIMGSSAGGHLAALTSTYFEKIDNENIDDIDNEDFIPNAQILAYPVIDLYNKNITHIVSSNNFTNADYSETDNYFERKSLSPNILYSPKAPNAFIWHTFADTSVNIKNTLEYAAAIRDAGKLAEVHIFPDGRHGLGLSLGNNTIEKHVSQWSNLLLNWLKYIEF